MGTTYSSKFNLAADKVVAMSELKAKTNALYKTELTTGEKAFLYLVDKPASIVAGLVMAFSGKAASKSGAYFDTDGLKMYVSGGYMNSVIDNAPFTASKAFDAKTHELTAKAFDQCEDHSKKPIMQKASMKKL